MYKYSLCILLYRVSLVALGSFNFLFPREFDRKLNRLTERVNSVNGTEFILLQVILTRGLCRHTEKSKDLDSFVKSIPKAHSVGIVCSASQIFVRVVRGVYTRKFCSGESFQANIYALALARSINEGIFPARSLLRNTAAPRLALISPIEENTGNIICRFCTFSLEKQETRNSRKSISMHDTGITGIALYRDQM